MICENILEFSNQLLPGKRLLGLDIGERKIGVAISDYTRMIATPFSLISSKSILHDIRSIEELVIADEVTGIVVGLPIQMDGQEGQASLRIRRFVDKLHKVVAIPVFLQDERLSTAAANRVLFETKLGPKKRALLDDKIAACLILQTVLDIMKILPAQGQENGR